MILPRADQPYRPREYWAALHGIDDLRAVGYPTLPLVFNQHLYANAAAGVLRGLDRAGIAIRDQNVLDVGSGTGFWVDLWLREGAANVAFSDIVPDAVDRLRLRFPDCAAVVGDIADRPPFPSTTFDVVTIMSVLLHVVDDARFRAALVNLASQLAPKGRLAVLDPLVVRERWMPPSREGAHNVARTLPQWKSAAADAGLRIVSIAPTASYFSDPVDAGSRAAFTAHRLWWRGITGVLRNRDRLAALVVPPVAALDRAVVRLLRSGPSSKLIVLERDY